MYSNIWGVWKRIYGVIYNYTKKVAKLQMFLVNVLSCSL